MKLNPKIFEGKKIVVATSAINAVHFTFEDVSGASIWSEAVFSPGSLPILSVTQYTKKQLES